MSYEMNKIIAALNEQNEINRERNKLLKELIDEIKVVEKYLSYLN